MFTLTVLTKHAAEITAALRKGFGMVPDQVTREPGAEMITRLDFWLVPEGMNPTPDYIRGYVTGISAGIYISETRPETPAVSEAGR